MILSIGADAIVVKTMLERLDLLTSSPVTPETPNHTRRLDHAEISGYKMTIARILREQNGYIHQKREEIRTLEENIVELAGIYRRLEDRIEALEGL